MCNPSLAKCMLVAFNTIFILVGVVLLTIGTLAKLDQALLMEAFNLIPDEITEQVTGVWDFGSFLTGGAYILMAVGGLLTVVGLCGCCGALNENKCLILCYAILVSLIILAQFGFVALWFTESETIETKAKELLKKSITTKYQDSEDAFQLTSDAKLALATDVMKLAWDSAQIAFECCGAESPEDYGDFIGTYTIAGASITNASVPLSCCMILNKEEYAHIQEEEEAEDDRLDSPIRIEPEEITDCLTQSTSSYRHQLGCFERLRMILKKYWLNFVAFLGGALFVELTGLTFSVVLLRGTRKGETYKPV